MTATTEPSLRALAEAADWRVRLTEAEVTSTPEFEAWLAKDADHASAWAQMQRAWSKLDAAAALPEVSSARLKRLQDADRLRRSAASTTRRKFAAAAALAVAAGSFGGWAWFNGRPETYETAVGERRSVTLADGSVVLLDSATRVDVQYGDEGRDLRLQRGQARFEVAKDNARAFRVTAGDRIVTATGTTFDIELLADTVQVTLLEGRVSVRRTEDAGRASAAPLDLRPGQRLVASAEAAPSGDTGDTRPMNVVRPAPPEATAWPNGLLVFEGEALPVVLERMNRHTTRRLVAVDDGARAIHLSGTFKAGDLNTFLDALTSYFPVSVDAGPSEVRISSSG